MQMRILFPLAGLVVCSFPLAAQLGKGGIQGTVRDSSGAAAPGAEVTVRNVSTNITIKLETNEQGFYNAPSLPVGVYELAVQRAGFRTAKAPTVALAVDQRAQVDFSLELGNLTESVTVVAQAPLTDTTSGTMGKVIEERRVLQLPINGRNALALMMLTPGVKSNAGPTNSGFADRGNAISAVSINGGPNSMNAAILDGGANNMAIDQEVSISPAVDTVEEFKVQSGVMSAELGFTAGGVINIVTKSGTNQIHGTVYEFLRNDALDARNAFVPAKTPFRYNQFGAAVGGPAVRNRTFYFLNWEEFRYVQSYDRVASMPTAAMREGDFSALSNATGRPIPLYDPATTRANPGGAGFVRDMFPGNLIPRNRLDPVALNIQNLYPLPNRTPSNVFTNENNYQNSPAEHRTMRQSTAKVDHRFSDYNALTARFSLFQHLTDAGSVPNVYPSDVINRRDDNMLNRNFILSDTHTFSPTLLNEFRAGFLNSVFTFAARSSGGGWPRTLGLPAGHPGDVFPQISNGLPGWNTAVGRRTNIIWHLFDAVTKIHRTHTLKAGVDYRLNIAHEKTGGAASGNFAFAAGLTGNPQSPAGTGSSYATFLLGAVSSASVNVALGQSQRGYSLSYFVQDDWKVNRRLTLNLGLRYDFQQQPYERNNGISNFSPFEADPVSGLLGRTVFAAVDGQGRTFRNEDHNDFAARAGFAYDVRGDGRMVVRGGYAMFYPNNFRRQTFAATAGFSNTTTSYLPTGGNTNFPAFQFSNGFPALPIQPLGARLGPSAFLGQGVTWDDGNGVTPMSQQFSLAVQRQLPDRWVVEAGYAGNAGRHFLAGTYDFNALDPAYYSLGLSLQTQVSNPYAARVPGALGAATISRLQSLRPYPYYSGITARYPRIGNYTYHSFVLSVERRLARGLSLLFSYTGGKLISDSVDTPVTLGGVEQVEENGFMNGKYDRRHERSIDPADVSQRGVISALYDLPVGRAGGWPRRLLGGWQVNTIGTVQTGLPIIVRGANNNLADRPNSTGKSARLANPSAARWFDTAQFVNPPSYTFGNLGRALPDVRTPGLVNWDLALIKNTQLRERISLQFRAEAFNFLNHVNLRAPNSNSRTGISTFAAGPDGRNQSGSFGVITSARDARILQLALKLIF